MKQTDNHWWNERTAVTFTPASGWLNVYRQQVTGRIWTTPSPGVLTVTGCYGTTKCLFAESGPSGEIIPAQLSNPTAYVGLPYGVAYVATKPGDWLEERDRMQDQWRAVEAEELARYEAADR